MAIDPVCGMTVDESRAPASAEHGGRTYYFCAPGCKRAFLADPERTLREGPKSMGTAPSPPPAKIVSIMPRAKTAPAPATAAPSLTLPLKRGGVGGGATTTTIPIEGMSCASCVARIEGGLRSVQGVVRASVNLATEQAVVEYLPTLTGPAALQETIRSIGYTPDRKSVV